MVGPTGAGKSRIAVQVAKRLGAEIVSCDSMQVYQGMDIGTAKINREEMEGIPHHLLDVRAPWEDFSVTDYQRIAQAVITEINRRGKIPILVGGTGLYYQAVVDDYQLQPMEKDREIRNSLVEEAELKGTESLYARLAEVDPAAAEKIKPTDQRRIVRALEVMARTGKTFSSQQKKVSERYRLAAAGINLARPQLYQRLEERIDKMLEAGFIEEVESLVKKGCRRDMTSMQALGYSHIISYRNGEETLTEMTDRLKRDTRRYAKRQLTWFRRDPRINWWDVADYKGEEAVIEKICEYFSRTLTEDVE